MNGYDVVVMGASWGGLKAFSVILPGLPGDFPAPVVIAQHRDDDSDDELLARLLNRDTQLQIVDAEDKAPLQAGQVLLAPPGYHLLVGDRHVELSVDEPVQFARPSIDVLFESAAEAYGPALMGIILSGANADGAAGLKAIGDRGGITVVQSLESAEMIAMPAAALEAAPGSLELNVPGLVDILRAHGEPNGR